MTSLLTGLALSCPLAPAHSLPPLPRLSPTPCRAAVSEPRSGATRAHRQAGRRARAHRCTFTRAHIHAAAHSAQTAITAEFNDPSTRPPSTCPPTPSHDLPLPRRSSRPSLTFRASSFSLLLTLFRAPTYRVFLNRLAKQYRDIRRIVRPGERCSMSQKW